MKRQNIQGNTACGTTYSKDACPDYAVGEYTAVVE
jgi:hypothetical protein